MKVRITFSNKESFVVDLMESNYENFLKCMKDKTSNIVKVVKL